MTLKELGLTEEDFNVESVNYNYKIRLKVNGVISPIELSHEMIQDFRCTANFDMESLLKSEAIKWYINDIKVIRKLKLKKIKEKYEIKNLC
jgi:hypothetical protein